jgi:hypothetical protein
MGWVAWVGRLVVKSLADAGLRCVAAPGTAIAAGDPVLIEVPPSDGGVVDLAASVVHRHADELGVEPALRFTDPPPAAAERIRASLATPRRDRLRRKWTIAGTPATSGAGPGSRPRGEVQ